MNTKEFFKNLKTIKLRILDEEHEIKEVLQQQKELTHILKKILYHKKNKSKQKSMDNVNIYSKKSLYQIYEQDHFNKTMTNFNQPINKSFKYRNSHSQKNLLNPKKKLMINLPEKNNHFEKQNKLDNELEQIKQNYSDLKQQMNNIEKMLKCILFYLYII